MKAVFITTKFQTLKTEEIIKNFNELRASDAKEFGNFYTGSFAEFNDIQIIGSTFTSREAASIFIRTNTEKWGHALAVIVKEDEKHFTLCGGWAAV